MPKLSLLACVVLAVPLAACGADRSDTAGGASTAAATASLPAVVPDDFPFPAGADLDTRTQQLASGKQTVVSFSFSQDAQALYDKIHQYALDHGYKIPVESKAALRFTARKPDGANFVVSIQDMGAVKIATVSFLASK